MRKPVFPRILIIALAYAVVFVLLVSVQFAKRGGFTRRVGDFVVSGQYLQPDENTPPAAADEYYLDGDVHVFFGGMDFSITEGPDGPSFYFEAADGTKVEALPERMTLSDDSALFAFPNGAELLFTTQYSGGMPELRISGSFSEDTAAMELPFLPLRRTALVDAGSGKLNAVADGVTYSFGLSPVDTERMLLRLNTEGVPVSYKAVPEGGTFSPDDFILPQAETAEAYNDFITRWRDANFSLWNRAISQRNDEDMVVALGGEALVRGTYKAAVAAVPPAFLRGTARTYESSVYLGGLSQAYRSLGTSDREKLARLSRLINEKSLEFLFEPNVVKYFAARGHFNFIEAAAELVRTIDPSVLSLDIVPGILEGYTDWISFRPGTENPFERLVDQACFVISESLRRIVHTTENSDSFGNRILVFDNEEGDTAFNLRLGKALAAYAGTARNESWAGVGRSIVLSVLSLGDNSGAIKAGLVLSGADTIDEVSDLPDITAARLYCVLNPIDTYPRAVALDTPENNVWTWTAARSVSAVHQNGVLDISVTFPAGETHYMIIRGIRPFARIQLYNIDFRSDPQFERYDSSGWSYISQEQTLIVKMRHRTAVEHIRVIYQAAPRPAAPPAAAAPQPVAAGASASEAPSAGEETLAP